MHWRLATAFLAGFSIAIFMASEIGTLAWWPIVTFVCGLIARYVLAQLLIGPLFGGDIKLVQDWANKHPLSAMFWTHALAHAQGRHPALDPLDCVTCNG